MIDLGLVNAKFVIAGRSAGAPTDPFVVAANGREWVVWSNGFVFIAVLDHPSCGHAPEGVQAAIRPHLVEPGPFVEVDLDRLRAWAGEARWERPCAACEAGLTTCDECGGSGSEECDPIDTASRTCEHGLQARHKALCAECGGAGRLRCERCGGSGLTDRAESRPGWVADTIVNRELVSRALACVVLRVDEERVVQIATPNPPLGPVLIEGEDWRIGVMPLRYAEEGVAERAPKLEL